MAKPTSATPHRPFPNTAQRAGRRPGKPRRGFVPGSRGVPAPGGLSHPSRLQASLHHIGPHPRKRGRRGFSLLEALIALVLTALVMAAISMALRTGLDASDRIRERSDSHAEARAALEMLAEDLRAAYLSGVNTEETYFTARPVEGVRPGDSFLRFSALSYRRSRSSGASSREPQSDTLQLEYSLRPSPRRDGPSTLVRQERWPTETGDGETTILCERVASLRLRYLDRNDYESDWSADAAENPRLTVYTGEDNSVPQRDLPRAVEITLLLSPPPGAPDGEKPRAYRTVVPIETDGVTPFEPEVVPPPPPSSDQGGGGGNNGGSNNGGGNPGG